jgi:hypothetical protein
MRNEIDSGQDYINVRDVIARVEELREDRDSYVLGVPDGTETPAPEVWGRTYMADAEELDTLETLLSELKGNGGNEQWEGEWYPVTRIRDSYFEEAMDEMLEAIGYLPKDLPRYLTVTVDYEALQTDYTSVEFDGVTYWYR